MEEKKKGKEKQNNKSEGVLGLWRAMQAVMRHCSQLLGTQPKISNDSRLTL